MTDETAFALIRTELEKARMKFPTWPDSDKIKGAAIVCEESGELIRAALQHVDEGADDTQCFREAIQTAAMCVRFIVGK